MLNYSDAKELLFSGSFVRRKSWEEGNFILHVKGTFDLLPTEGTPYHKALGPNVKCNINHHIDMCTDHNGLKIFSVGWIPTDDDITANDWEVVDAEA